MLRFANQPKTTRTRRLTRDGRDSEGDAIRVEIYDPVTGKTSVVGATGLGDCSTPVSACGPNLVSTVSG